MSEKKEKLPFREMMGLIRYGFAVIVKLIPSYLPCMLLRSFVTALQPLLVVFFSARIINELAGAQEINIITMYAVFTVASGFVLSVVKALINNVLERNASWERLYYHSEMMETERFASMDFIHAEDGKVGELLARMDTMSMGNGVGIISMFTYPAMISENFFSLIISILLLTGLLPGGGAVNLGWQSQFALIGIMVVGVFFMFRYHSKEKILLNKVYSTNAKANTSSSYYRRYIQSDGAAKDIRIYNQSGVLAGIFYESLNLTAWLPVFFFWGRQSGFLLAILSAVSGFLYLTAGLGAVDGNITIGAIVQSVGAVTALASAIGSLLTGASKFYNNAEFLKPLKDFMTMPDILIKGHKNVPQTGDLEFEFKNVSFRYPGSESYALNGLNLKLNAGRRHAVVGLNGSGKTTMIKLLCRLYDPTEGKILLNGIDIKEYDYSQYMALFSVVFQDYKLFPPQLGQNVAVSRQYDADKVKNSLDGANFAERLEKLPNGLETILDKSYDDDGVQVSGGEAQKIAMARALYKNAPVVVLDEPTSALDPIAEYEVYTSFDRTIGGKTAVFISHRLSSCRFCHEIAVFDSGRLVQCGTHDELLANGSGRYFELWEAQARHYKDKEAVY